MTDELHKKNKRLILIVFGVVIFMVGLSFASVPLYRIFCQVTGFGGTPQRIKSISGEVLDRTIKIRFNADVNQALPWTFKPEIVEMELRIGETGLMNYVTENKLNQPVIGTAVYNVTPHKAGIYFGKIQCFCFEEQLLMPNQKMIMPVFFYIDPAIDKDKNLKNLDAITLSYTFYKSKTQDLDDAIETYYKNVESFSD